MNKISLDTILIEKKDNNIALILSSVAYCFNINIESAIIFKSCMLILND